VPHLWYTSLFFLCKNDANVFIEKNDTKKNIIDLRDSIRNNGRKLLKRLNDRLGNNSSYASVHGENQKPDYNQNYNNGHLGYYDGHGQYGHHEQHVQYVQHGNHGQYGQHGQYGHQHDFY
jgi:hypothetical protein